MTAKPSDTKRKDIIRGATTMFLEHGFNTVSMDKIARAAPVSKATLYKYFDSKNVLFTAVIDELSDSLFQTMDEALLDSASVENNLKNIATAFVDLIFTEEALAIYRLVISECRDFPELGRLLYEGAPKDLLNQLEHYLIHINKLESINIASPAFAADAFLSLLKGELHFQCLLGIKEPPSVEEKKAHINQVVAFYSQGFIYAH
jgi:TetR/AcrR family transcriptional repressor of mexJK operon